jgi:hypothetical protein
MKKSLVVSLSAAAIVFAPAVALSDEVEFDYFSSPTKNINCIYENSRGNIKIIQVRCDIMHFKPTLKLKAIETEQTIEIFGHCTKDKMRAFVIDLDSVATNVFCPSDAPIASNQSIIPYNSSWQKNGFICVSQTSGMRCQNNLGHGFFLSRNQQSIF